MDLSKVFHCIPHDLSIAKLHVCGMDFHTVSFQNLNLKDRKQNVRIYNVLSVFQYVLLGVPQGSILGPILANMFLNNLFLWIKKSGSDNFSDDNTITVTCNTLAELLKILEKGSE